MFFSVARLRLFIAFALLFSNSFTQALEQSLFTSSVSYCAPPESLLISQFDIAYIEKNSSVVFNISAGSVVPNLNVSANLMVNVYGMQPLNFSIDLCSVFSGALCPLPTYNFTGSDSLKLPASVDIASKIPGIAYKIPDLEAFAQLTLIEVGTGTVRACVQSTLSNGWSARQKAVEWTTGGIALLSLVSAMWQSYMPMAFAPVRLLDLIYLFQTIAASGLLGLNYPSVYRAYTLNFSWALGFFPTTSTSSIQRSINNMRNRTGGNLADATSGNAVSLVNRKLSPYNVPTSSLFVSPVTFSVRRSSTFLPDLNTLLSGTTRRKATESIANVQTLVGGDVATVTQESSNVLQAGIPIYVNTIGIATANAFMTIFLVSLMLAAIVLATLGMGYGVLLALSRKSRGTQREHTFQKALAAYPGFARAWGLRAVLVAVFPISIFTFYQWTLKDSWLSILLSVIMFVATLALLTWPTYAILRRTRFLRDVDASSTPPTALQPLMAPFHSHHVYYAYLALLAIMVKALVIAFGKSRGMVQAIIILITEIVLLTLLSFMKPHHTRAADVLAIFLAVVRVVCAGLLIAFSESIGLAAIPRVVIGIIIAVIFSVTVVIMFLNVLVNVGLWFLPVGMFNRGLQGGRLLPSASSSDASILESGKAKALDEKRVTPPPSEFQYARPGNPTPTHTPTTASLSPPTTAYSHTTDLPSTYTTTSAFSTLGEALPRRWSFQHSRPPSATTSPGSGTFTLTPSMASSPISAYTTPRHSRRLSTSVEGQYGDEGRS